jgi:3-hydroxybutyryl-CoA dehydrogenase
MIKKICIIGSGTMGRGLAQLCTSRGIDVALVGLNERALDECIHTLEEELCHRISRWSLTSSEKAVILKRITPTTELDDARDADYVIEAIFEEFDAKKRLFERLGQLFPADIVLATNTSSLSITDISEATEHPERVIGMHFLYPPAERKIVEIVHGIATSPEAYEQSCELVKQLGIEAVEVYESPGFIATRVIIPFVNEAMHALMEGVATAEDIDKAIRLGYNISMGPLEVADTIGLDVVYRMMEVLFRTFGELKYRPSVLLRKMVREGRLGRKTGHGFFRYDAEGRKLPPPEKNKEVPK